MALINKLTAIANAIRAKTGKTDTMTLDEMPTEIASISGGGSATLITKSITANGTYPASADGADGYSSVEVNVSGGGGILHESGIVDCYGGISSFLDIPISDATYAHYYVEAKLVALWTKNESAEWVKSENVDFSDIAADETQIALATAFTYPPFKTPTIIGTNGGTLNPTNLLMGATGGSTNTGIVSSMNFVGGPSIIEKNGTKYLQSSQRRSTQDNRAPIGGRYAYEVWGWN